MATKQWVSLVVAKKNFLFCCPPLFAGVAAGRGHDRFELDRYRLGLSSLENGDFWSKRQAMAGLAQRFRHRVERATGRVAHTPLFPRREMWRFKLFELIFFIYFSGKQSRFRTVQFRHPLDRDEREGTEENGSHRTTTRKPSEPDVFTLRENLLGESSREA